MNSPERQSNVPHKLTWAERQKWVIHEGVVGGSVIAGVIHLIEHNLPAASFDVVVATMTILSTREGRVTLKEILTGNIDVFTPEIYITSEKPDK